MQTINLIRNLKAKKSFLHTFLKPFFPFYKYLCKLKRYRVCNFETFNFNVDLKEYIDNELYFNGYFEKDITDIIVENTKSGMVVFDIGANTGVHTLRFASLVGPSGFVYAFEPTEFAYNRLMKNLGINSFNNIKTEKIALSDKISENQNIDFRSSWNFDHMDDPLKAVEIVNFTTIDSYIIDNNITRVDIIKIDIDGFEYLALSGGMRLLSDLKPMIIIELSRNLDGDTKFEEYINFLLNLDYNFIFPSLSLRKVSKFAEIDAIVPYGNDTINALLVQ